MLYDQSSRAKTAFFHHFFLKKCSIRRRKKQEINGGDFSRPRKFSRRRLSKTGLFFPCHKEKKRKPFHGVSGFGRPCKVLPDWFSAIKLKTDLFSRENLVGSGRTIIDHRKLTPIKEDDIRRVALLKI